MKSFINPKVEVVNKPNVLLNKKPLEENIIKNKEKSGRPPKYTLEQLIKKFKKYIKSKDNLLKNPSLLFNRRLLLEARGNKEHWFWSAKHLPLRIKELENKWYGSENSIVCFLLKSTGWFSDQEAISLSKELHSLAKHSAAKKISKNAKERFKDKAKRKQVSLKLKIKWKDKNYKNNILEKLVLASLKRRQLKRNNSSPSQPIINLDESTKYFLIRNFFKKNYTKIKKLQKKINQDSSSLIKISNNHREWILENFENNNSILRYVILPPLIGVYLLYCQKERKILNFEKLSKIDFDFYKILTKLYKDEFEILNKVLKVRPDIFLFIYKKN
ncbi:MAG: hypothetical protein QXV64_00105 [Candidatus Anstonellaceae archaeon]